MLIVTPDQAQASIVPTFVCVAMVEATIVALAPPAVHIALYLVLALVGTLRSFLDSIMCDCAVPRQET